MGNTSPPPRAGWVPFLCFISNLVCYAGEHIQMATYSCMTIRDWLRCGDDVYYCFLLQIGLILVSLCWLSVPRRDGTTQSKVPDCTTGFINYCTVIGEHIHSAAYSYQASFSGPFLPDICVLKCLGDTCLGKLAGKLKRKMFSRQCFAASIELHAFNAPTYIYLLPHTPAALF